MNRSFLKILCFFFLCHTSSCAKDPLLNPVDQSADNYAYKDITITNNSKHALGVCEFSNCEFNVPAGQTVTVPVRYYNYDKSKVQDYLTISIQTSAERRVGTLKSMSWSPFLTEGSQIRWLGNFSGPHSFTVTAELAAEARDYLKDHEDYARNIESRWKYAKLLNLSDAHLSIKSQIFDDAIEITLPEEDSEVFWGLGVTNDPDGASAEGGIVLDSWRYERVPKLVNKILFSDYTNHENFKCNDGGCFPEF